MYRSRFHAARYWASRYFRTSGPPADNPTANIRDAVYARMTGSADLAELVSDRIYPGLPSQGADYPHVTFYIVGSESAGTIRRYAGVSRYSVQFNIWGLSQGDVIQIRKVLRILFLRWRGRVDVDTADGVETLVIRSIRPGPETDLPQYLGDGSDVQVRRIVAEFEFNVTEPY